MYSPFGALCGELASLHHIIPSGDDATSVAEVLQDIHFDAVD